MYFFFNLTDSFEGIRWKNAQRTCNRFSILNMRSWINKCMNHLGKHHWPSWTMRTRFKLVGSGANEVKIMVQLSCVHPRLILSLLQGSISLLFSVHIFNASLHKCKFSSLWIRQGCKWKSFDWFWSCSCWECRSVLKHAWQRETITAYYHIKGATTLVPFI